jgi:hypothetical protein
MPPLPVTLLLLAAPARAAEPIGVEAGVALFRARHPAEACVVLLPAAAEEADPAARSRARYYLARSLNELGLPISAERELAVLAGLGSEDPYFLHALPGLLDIARQTGDESTLRAVAPRYALVDLPPAVAAEVRLQQGLAAWRAGDLRQALDLLEGVPEGTPAFARAAYMRGLSQEDSREKTAVKAYRDAALAAGQDAGGRELATLATLRISAIYEGIGRLDEAEGYAGLVAHDSALWPDALTVLGRCALSRGDPLTALDRLQAATSPFLRTDLLVLEADLLRAQALAAVCRRDEAQAGLAGLGERIGPMEAELATFLSQHRDPSGGWRDPAGAWATYFEGFPEDSALDRALFVEVLRADPDLVGALRRLALLKREHAALEDPPPAWRVELVTDLSAGLESDRSATRARAGALLLEGLDAQRAAMAALAPRIEAAAATLDTPCTPQETTSVTSDAWNSPWQPTAPAAAWPFTGEIWADELDPWVGEGR